MPLEIFVSVVKIPDDRVATLVYSINRSATTITGIPPRCLSYRY